MNFFGKNRSLKSFVFSIIYLAFFFSIGAKAQDLPKKIRGYRVYQAEILIKNSNEKSAARDKSKDVSETFVRVGEPEIKDVSLTGITLEIPAEINPLDQSGTVDFLVFRDFRVNDLKVKIEEYREPFDFYKNQRIVLPKPIEIFIGVGQTLRGAASEFRNSKKEWTITGTVFVFGHFKKSFLKFKRVVPIEINLKIKNPLHSVSSRQSSVKNFNQTPFICRNVEC